MLQYAITELTQHRAGVTKNHPMAFVDHSQVLTDNKIEVTIRTIDGPKTVEVETFDVSPPTKD